MLLHAGLRLAFLVLLAVLALPGAARAQTVVSLTFDDGIATQMLVRPALQSHGMHGTFYMNSGNVGTSSNYMTWANVDALNADGNEIGGHTVNHKRLTDLTAAQQRQQICDDAAALRARGYTVNDFAYPYGAGSSSATVRQALVDCGYLSARNFGDLRSEGCTDADCAYAETIPPADAYAIRTPEWQPDEYSLSDLESWVVQAETHGGGWVPIVLHDICNQCADSSVSLSTFSALLDWLQARGANGTVVKTVREAISPAAPSADVSVTKSDSPDPVTAGGNVTYTITLHNGGPNTASGVTLTDPLQAGLALVSASSTKGTCSGTATVSCNIGTLNAGAANDVTVTIVATAGWGAVPSVSNTATAAASTPDPGSSNNQASAQTTVNPAYVHPRGASPTRVSLVPAYVACDAAHSNSTHGPPLASPSCAPPRRASTELTVGTPDANGAKQNFIGTAAMQVLAGNPTTPQDEANVELDFSLTDVRNADDLTDYTGELNGRAGIRLTDRRNGPSGVETATVSDFELAVPIPCAATAAGVGATCAISTTADAITPGIVVEGARSIWGLAKVVVDDGGSDGVASTPGNAPFAVQGVFVP